MTTNELFDKITSEPKWYAGKLSAQSASNIKKKHKSGKYTNYEWFFGLFGYIKIPNEWYQNKYELELVIIRCKKCKHDNEYIYINNHPIDL